MIRSPLANLDTTPVAPGLVAVVSVLFGSTAFDSFRDSTRWVKFIQGNYVQDHGLPGCRTTAGCSASAGRGPRVLCRDHADRGRAGPAAPRAARPVRALDRADRVGYIVAHYLTYLVEVGPADADPGLSDPFSNGSNLVRDGNWQVSYWLLLPPDRSWPTVKVLCVVTGHVVGVIAAHDRAIKLLPKRHQLTGQLSLLAAMIAFTVGGLYLLFAA